MNIARRDCPMRHPDNGNCLPAGGFCTAVNDLVCAALHDAYDLGGVDSVRRVKTKTEKQTGGTGDEYKVKQLQKMLAHETSEGEVHYGAHLSHGYSGAAHLTIDAGGLRALIEHYQSHDTDLGNGEG